MKKLLQKAGIAVLAMTLTGCFKMRMNFDVKSDATYTGEYTMLMSESMLSMGGQDVDASLDQMIEEQKKEDPEAEIEKVREGEGENAYAGIKVKNFKTEGITVTKNDNVITVEIPLAELQDEIESEADLESMGISMSALKEYGAEAIISVNMPGTPEANTGTIEGNKVTVDLLEANDTETLIITCKAGMSNAMKIGLGAAGALAVVLILFLVIKNRKKN